MKCPPCSESSHSLCRNLICVIAADISDDMGDFTICECTCEPSVLFHDAASDIYALAEIAAHEQLP